MTAASSAQKIAIIGAGFSGLTLAWALEKKGFEVEIFEASDRVGGLISSQKKQVLVETAANAILGNAWVEELFRDLGVEALPSGFRSKKRWIYRGRPRKLPLSMKELIRGFSNLANHFRKKQVRFREDESVANWASRTLSPEIRQHLISPGLQGVYATRAEELSASLVLGGFFEKDLRPPKGHLKGSVAPTHGMGELTEKLQAYLKSKQVVFHFSQSVIIKDLSKKFSAIVLATSAPAAAQLLSVCAPEASGLLSRVKSLPLVSVTLGFKKSSLMEGFGCLFPDGEGFQALGVLNNTDIFPNRGSLKSETWILGNNIENIATLSKEKILSLVQKDRARLVGVDEPFEFSQVTPWPQAIPLYGFQLKAFLESGVLTDSRRTFDAFRSGARIKESEFPIYLTGNYLGGIGLAKILGYNLRLANRMKRELA